MKIVKKFNYLFIVLAVLIPLVAGAASVNKTLTFSWEDPNPEGLVEGWYLYIADEDTLEAYAKVIDTDGNPLVVTKDSTTIVDGSYQAANPFVISGTSNTVVTKYFKLSAYATDVETGDILESELSNSASHYFKIPLLLNAPVLIKVEEIQ